MAPSTACVREQKCAVDRCRKHRSHLFAPLLALGLEPPVLLLLPVDAHLQLLQRGDGARLFLLQQRPLRAELLVEPQQPLLLVVQPRDLLPQLLLLRLVLLLLQGQHRAVVARGASPCHAAALRAQRRACHWRATWRRPRCDLVAPVARSLAAQMHGVDLLSATQLTSFEDEERPLKHPSTMLFARAA